MSPNLAQSACRNQLAPLPHAKSHGCDTGVDNWIS